MSIKTKTATILAGNSDNKLPQLKWALFQHDLIRVVECFAVEIHFSGHTHGDSKYQTASFTFTIPAHLMPELAERLSGMAATFEQHSIALVVGKTKFCKSAK